MLWLPVVTETVSNVPTMQQTLSLITEWNLEEAQQAWLAQGRDEGRSEGRNEGIEIGRGRSEGESAIVVFDD